MISFQRTSAHIHKILLEELEEARKVPYEMPEKDYFKWLVVPGTSSLAIRRYLAVQLCLHRHTSTATQKTQEKISNTKLDKRLAIAKISFTRYW